MRLLQWISTILVIIAVVLTAWFLLRPRKVYIWQGDRQLGQTVNTSQQEEYEPNFTPDGKHLIFTRGKAGKNADLFIAAIKDGVAGEASPISSVNTGYDEIDGMLGIDDNLYFYSDRPDGVRGYDLYCAPLKDDGTFGDCVNLGQDINSNFNDYDPCLSPDGKLLYFSSNRHSNGSEEDYNLFVSLKTEKGWSEPKQFDALNTEFNEWEPMVSPDGKTIYFTTNRIRKQADGSERKDYDLYASTFQEEGWSQPVNLGDKVNSEDDEFDPCVSPDGEGLFYVRGKRIESTYDVDIWSGWRTSVPAPPIVQVGEIPRSVWLIISLLTIGAVFLLLLIFYWDRMSVLQKCLVGSVAVHCLVAWVFTMTTMESEIEHFMRKDDAFVVFTDIPEDVEQEKFLAAMLKDFKKVKLSESPEKKEVEVAEAAVNKEKMEMEVKKAEPREEPEVRKENIEAKEKEEEQVELTEVQKEKQVEAEQVVEKEEDLETPDKMVEAETKPLEEPEVQEYQFSSMEAEVKNEPVKSVEISATIRKQEDVLEKLDSKSSEVEQEVVTASKAETAQVKPEFTPVSNSEVAVAEKVQVTAVSSVQASRDAEAPTQHQDIKRELSETDSSQEVVLELSENESTEDFEAVKISKYSEANTQGKPDAPLNENVSEVVVAEISPLKVSTIPGRMPRKMTPQNRSTKMSYDRTEREVSENNVPSNLAEHTGEAKTNLETEAVVVKSQNQGIAKKVSMPTGPVSVREAGEMFAPPSLTSGKPVIVEGVASVPISLTKNVNIRRSEPGEIEKVSEAISFSETEKTENRTVVSAVGTKPLEMSGPMAPGVETVRVVPEFKSTIPDGAKYNPPPPTVSIKVGSVVKIGKAPRVSKRESVAKVVWGDAKNLGKEINSRGEDYEPNLSVDGKTMLFTRGGAGENADIFVSFKKEGKWTKPEKFTQINSTADDIDAHLSADGKSVVFYSNRSGSKGYDIYISEKKKGEWQTPVKMGDAVNSDRNDYDPVLSVDGKQLFFSTNRDSGTEEDYDIYCSKKDKTGKWSKAEKVQVNTKLNEWEPAISVDGKSLYFTSNRPGGKGGYDIWVSHFRNGKWQKAVNLGNGVNGAGDELDPAVSGNGTTLYFVSNRKGGQGSFDIWRARRSLKE